MALLLCTPEDPGTAEWAQSGSTAVVQVVDLLGIDQSGANPLPQVVAAPSRASGSATVGATLGVGNALTIGTQALTGVAGARTPGSNDFNASLGTVAALAIEIVTAINDPTNNFDEVAGSGNGVYATYGGGGVVNIFASQAGTAGNDLALSSNTGNITVSGATLTGGGVRATKTISFVPAPRDILLKQLLVSVTVNESVDGFPQILRLTSITVDGGANLVTGYVTVPITSGETPATSPDMDITVLQGQVVSITFDSVSNGNAYFHATWTAVDLPADPPTGKIYLGGPETSPIINSATRATAPLTVDTAASVVAGDTIVFDFNGSVEVLTGVAAARTSGQNDFDTSGTASQIVASIVAAVNDASNTIDDTSFTATDNDPIVTITGNGGYQGNDSDNYSVTVNSSGMSPATLVFTGGANTSGDIVFPAAPQDMTLERLYLTAILAGGAAVVSRTMVVTAVTVDGGANLLSGGVAGTVLASTSEQEGPLFDIALTAGQVVTVTIENVIPDQQLGMAAAWVARPS
jgi:hypothetical protein